MIIVDEEAPTGPSGMMDSLSVERFPQSYSFFRVNLFWRKTMRGLAWVGVLLVVLGIAALAVRGFSYTTKEKVLDLGPIQATADKQHDVYIYPAAGIAAILVGGALVVFGRKRA
jgi:drug/metabolite transporter (DMT)-like permease